jgi:hypothetical protein
VSPMGRNNNKYMQRECVTMVLLPGLCRKVRYKELNGVASTVLTVLTNTYVTMFKGVVKVCCFIICLTVFGCVYVV